MAGRWQWLCLSVIIFAAVLALFVLAPTDELEAQVLRDMYRGLNNPTQLKGWKSDGGDPCGESWIGVSCDGSSIIYIDLHVLGITGTLEINLLNLKSLKQLDLNFNNLQGEIPPVSITHLDISYNNFSGDLPSCFGFLKNLRRLSLSGNGFTGSVTPLAHLQLSEPIAENIFESKGKMGGGQIGGIVAGTLVASLLVVTGIWSYWTNFNRKSEILQRLERTSSVAFNLNRGAFVGEYILEFIRPIINIDCGVHFFFITANMDTLHTSGNFPQAIEPIVMQTRTERTIQINSILNTFAEVGEATDFFHGDNQLGMGTIGTVYKGVLNGEQPPMAHGNLTAENVLLAEGHPARVFDYVLATRTSTPMTDIKDFGLLLLELLTGRANLVAWAHQRLYHEDLLATIVDNRIGGELDHVNRWEFAQIVLMCLEGTASSMNTVLMHLNDLVTMANG